MNIVILTGSPRHHGNSNYLADRFQQGAEQSGHHVERFDCTAPNLHDCVACNRCGMNGDCAVHDDFSDILRPRLLEADMVVFVTPMYYFGFSGYLKRVIDRFYAINESLRSAPKKTALIMACAGNDEKNTEPMLLHYRALAAYLGWEDAGTILATGLGAEGSAADTPYCDAAYALGLSL